MIGFKDFLAEGRDASVYHGTTLTWFDKILDTGKLLFRTVHPPQFLLKNKPMYGMSTSRNKQFAFQYGGKQILIAFDQTALARDYQLIPVNYSPTEGARSRESIGSVHVHGSEYEEFVTSKTKDHIPLTSRYIKKVWIRRPLSSDRLDWAMEIAIEQKLEKLGIPVEFLSSKQKVINDKV